jgi:hypothetical protein
MADPFIEYRIEGEEEIERAFERMKIQSKIRVKNVLDDLAEFGVRTLEARVPRSSTYIFRHIDMSPTIFHPGGAGGGGEYRKVFGIKHGTSRHPLYVEQGTGIYGVVGWFIFPDTSKYMYFFSQRYGRVIRVKQLRGQRPRRYFLNTWNDLQVYAQSRVMLTNLLY